MTRLGVRVVLAGGGDGGELLAGLFVQEGAVVEKQEATFSEAASPSETCGSGDDPILSLTPQPIDIPWRWSDSLMARRRIRRTPCVALQPLP